MSAPNRTEILFNRLFAGSFLDDHIGHEIVNLYKDDHGDNYLYIQPYGTYEISHHKKIEAVLLVRGIEGKHAVEVLGLATGLTEIFDPALDYKASWKAQVEYIKKNDIRYGGVSLLDIFDRKTENEINQPVYVSMKASHVMRPSRPVYLIYGKDVSITDKTAKILNLPHTNQAKCSLKQYFTESANPGNNEDYNILMSLINDASLWTRETYSLKEENHEDGDFDEESFWTICAVADYELAWSNALAHFMKKYPEDVVAFAKARFGIADKPFTTVERETDNIDILLENDDSLVVIENKITSKINGIQVKDEKLVGTQLIKYHRKALERLCKPEHPINDYDAWLQCKNRCKKNIRCYVLTPNYNPIDLDAYNTPHDGTPGSPIFVCKDFYKEIFYKDIYDFIKNLHPEDNYFQEMLKGMKKHTKEYHDDLFDVTRKKFLRQIENIKSK